MVCHRFFQKVVFTLVSSTVLLCSCQSFHPPLPLGLQQGYQARNPASIIAVPVFFLPHPADDLAVVDLSFEVTENIANKIEEKIIDSFIDQPDINGYPFHEVSQVIENSKRHVWTDLNAILQRTALKLQSHKAFQHSGLKRSCLFRKNFIEFYSYCLASEQSWIESLNRLASFVMNSDAALLVVVTHLQSQVLDHKYSIRAGCSVLLVDTNNGKLIWGKESSSFLENAVGQEFFPNWRQLIDQMFVPSFWIDFPGRI
jgi:hypothetical protein